MRRLALAALIAISSASASAAPPSGEPGGTMRIYAWTSIVEKPGTVETTPLTSDAWLEVTYVGGLSGVPAPPGAAGRGTVYGATVHLQIKDCVSGDPLLSAAGVPVCAPCTLQVDAANRTASFKLDDLIMAAGGFPASSTGAPERVCGFGLIEVSGDADRVMIDPLGASSGNTPNPTPLNGPCGGGGGTGSGGHVTLIK